MARMTAQEAAEWGKTLTFEKVWAMFGESAEQMKIVEEKQAEAAAQISKTSQELADLKVTVERVTADDGGLRQSMADLNKTVDRVTANVERVTADVGRVTGNVDGLSQSMADLNKTVDRVTADVGRVTGNVDGLSQSMKDLNKTVERVSNNVGGLNRSVGELVETLIAARLWEKFPAYNLARAYQRIPLYDEKNVRRTDIDILLVNTDLCMAVEVKHALDRMDEVDRHLKRMQLIRQYPPELVGAKQLLGAMAGGVVDPDVQQYAYASGFFVLELTGESVHLIQPPKGFEPKKW